MLYIYELCWENKTGEREYFWSAYTTEADAISLSLWQVAFPAPVSHEELTNYANSNWCLPMNEDGEEDLKDFNNIPAYGLSTHWKQEKQTD